MKKTLIALVALSGLASAATNDQYGDVTGTWVTYSGSWSTTETSASIGTGWGGATALYLLDNAITLEQHERVLFSYTYTNPATTQNSIYGITLRGASGAQAIVFGNTDYGNANIAISAAPLAATGYADCTAKDTELPVGTAQALRGNHGNSGDRFQDVTFAAANTIDVSVPVSYTVDSEIAFDTTLGQFVLTSTVGENTVKLELGNSVSFNTIVFATDGNNQQTFSNLSLQFLPEPATATLSLLALAGLAARRKRR